MGYYSVAVFHNDFANELARDPHAGEKISAAISGFTIKAYRPERSHFHYGSVIAQNHFDYAQVLVVGGRVGTGIGGSINDPEVHLDQEALWQMQTCLENHGYRVTKRRKSLKAKVKL